MVLPASGLIRKVGGMIAYQEARDIVQFMCTGINRHAAQAYSYYNKTRPEKL